MTKIFRKTSRNKPEETDTYDFTPIRNYESFRNEECMEKKFTFKSKIFWREIRAYNPKNNIKITSITLDFLMTRKTQLCMHNIATNMLSIMADLSNCQTSLMEFKDHPYETDLTANCNMIRHDYQRDDFLWQRRFDICIQITPRPTITRITIVVFL